ncbi:MAG: polyprenyl synthetase family protein [Chloroflexota bacterium]|nr:polyprenyl synthetase family protein [Chloroflexota bacterium]
MLDYKKNIEEILTRNNLGIYELMRYHFGLGSDSDKKFPYGELTEIFSKKFHVKENIYKKIGLSLELLNASFEVHEDVRNGNTERSKAEALWWKYGPAQAINVGDGFQAMSRSILLELSENSNEHENIIEIVSNLDKSIIEICEAENYELKLQELPQSEINDYEKSIVNKYGTLLSNCFVLPSKFISDPINNLREFSNKLVLHEKIKREIDFFESDDDKDSPELGSFLSKTKPLTVILAMKDANPSQKRELGEIYIQRVIDPKNIKRIKDICFEIDSVNKIKTMSEDYKKYSLNIMNKLGFDDSEKNNIFDILENI